jgi:hypothetical protein
MACEGGECKVQIFDVKVDGVSVAGRVLRTPGTIQPDPGDNICRKPTRDQLAEFLRRKPVWLAKCPHPHPAEANSCQCVFTKDDLDPSKGWTPWVERPAPPNDVEIPGTDGPDKADNTTCLTKLQGKYFESSKILHGACMDPVDDAMDRKMKDALDQRNPAPVPS